MSALVGEKKLRKFKQSYTQSHQNNFWKQMLLVSYRWYTLISVYYIIFIISLIISFAKTTHLSFKESIPNENLFVRVHGKRNDNFFRFTHCTKLNWLSFVYSLEWTLLSFSFVSVGKQVHASRNKGGCRPGKVRKLCKLCVTAGSHSPRRGLVSNSLLKLLFLCQCKQNNQFWISIRFIFNAGWNIINYLLDGNLFNELMPIQNGDSAENK